jgi:hypothetical protein
VVPGDALAALLAPDEFDVPGFEASGAAAGLLLHPAMDNSSETARKNRAIGAVRMKSSYGEVRESSVGARVF